MDIRTNGPYPPPPPAAGGVRPMIGNARPGKLFRPGPGRPGLSRLVPMFKHSVVDLGDSNLPATGPPVGHAIIVGQSVSNAATF